jgi:serine/threonine protein kinase
VQGTTWKSLLHPATEEEKGLSSRYTLKEHIEILHAVTNALAFAHEKNIIHRDLKPANVMLGRFGEVILLDWGMAVSLEPCDEIISLKETNGFGGTLPYMAPEMACAEIEHVGKHSDIYLLGAILYEILTGQPPHAGKTTPEMWKSALNNSIAPPEDGKSVDLDLLDIALKAMAHEPGDRFPDAVAFKDALKEWETHLTGRKMLQRAHEILVEADKTHDYKLYSQALGFYNEADQSWPENPDVAKGRDAVLLAYIFLAQNQGDYDLALSLLDGKKEENNVLIKEITLKKNRRARWKNIGKLFIVASLLLSLVAIGGWYNVNEAKKKNKELYIQADTAAKDARRQKDVVESLVKDALLNGFIDPTVMFNLRTDGNQDDRLCIILPLLNNMLLSPSTATYIKIQIIKALSPLTSRKEAADILQQSLGDPSPLVRLMADSGLHKTGLDKIVECISNGNYIKAEELITLFFTSARDIAITTLKERTDPEDIPALLKQLSKRSSNIPLVEEILLVRKDPNERFIKMLMEYDKDNESSADFSARRNNLLSYRVDTAQALVALLTCLEQGRPSRLKGFFSEPNSMKFQKSFNITDTVLEWLVSSDADKQENAVTLLSYATGEAGMDAIAYLTERYDSLDESCKPKCRRVIEKLQKQWAGREPHKLPWNLKEIEQQLKEKANAFTVRPEMEAVLKERGISVPSVSTPTQDLISLLSDSDFSIRRIAWDLFVFRAKVEDLPALYDLLSRNFIIMVPSVSTKGMSVLSLVEKIAYPKSDFFKITLTYLQDSLAAYSEKSEQERDFFFRNMRVCLYSCMSGAPEEVDALLSQLEPHSSDLLPYLSSDWSTPFDRGRIRCSITDKLLDWVTSKNAERCSYALWLLGNGSRAQGKAYLEDWIKSNKNPHFELRREQVKQFLQGVSPN